MAETLQGFQPDRMLNMIWTVLAGWIVWPILCAFLGAGRGSARKGFMHGLVWGPFGVIFILASKRKYDCPTCGCQTLSADLHRRLATTPTTPPPMAHPAVAIEPPTAIHERRRNVTIPAPIAGSSAPAKSVVEEACAGYSAEESARLLAWVNQQADALGLSRQEKPTVGATPVVAT